MRGSGASRFIYGRRCLQVAPLVVRPQLSARLSLFLSFFSSFFLLLFFFAISLVRPHRFDSRGEKQEPFDGRSLFTQVALRLVSSRAQGTRARSPSAIEVASAAHKTSEVLSLGRISLLHMRVGIWDVLARTVTMSLGKTFFLDN